MSAQHESSELTGQSSPNMGRCAYCGHWLPLCWTGRRHVCQRCYSLHMGETPAGETDG